MQQQRHDQPSLAGALALHGLSSPNQADQAERLLIRMEAKRAATNGHSTRLDDLIGLLRERVAALGTQELVRELRQLQ